MYSVYALCSAIYGDDGKRASGVVIVSVNKSITGYTNSSVPGPGDRHVRVVVSCYQGQHEERSDD